MKTLIACVIMAMAVTVCSAPRLEKVPQSAQTKEIRNALDLTPEQIDALKAYRDADIDALFPSLTAAQRKFLKVGREINMALLKAYVKEVQ